VLSSGEVISAHLVSFYEVISAHHPIIRRSCNGASCYHPAK